MSVQENKTTEVIWQIIFGCYLESVDSLILSQFLFILTKIICILVPKSQEWLYICLVLIKDTRHHHNIEELSVFLGNAELNYLKYKLNNKSQV